GGGVGGLLDVRRHRQQQIEQPFLYFLLGDVLYLGLALAAHHVDGTLDQVADHRFDVASDVADFGELGRFDFHKGSTGQSRQAPRDLRLTDTSGTNEDDVVGDRKS